MAVITLTTDLGMRDHYAGSLKGALMSAIPGSTIIDITHEIEPFNILHAAEVIRNCYGQFPANTLHLISVNLHDQRGTRTLMVKRERYCFVLPDNGLIGLIWEDDKNSEVYAMPSGMPWRDSLVHAARISLHDDLEKTGERITDYRISRMSRPLIAKEFIKGSIIYFDRFGNAVVNISRTDFEGAVNGRKFTLLFKRYSDLDSFGESYASVDEGEKVCFFNSSGNMEIALNKGNAKQLLNLNTGDSVQIDFH